MPVPESKWQPYNMPQYNHEIETIDELRHLGTFALKPPYRFGTHEHDPMKTEYTKLEPSVLTIASSTMAGLRKPHTFLSKKHYEVVSNANAAIVELGKTICIDSWGPAAPFPYEMARSAPDTSFDEHGNLGGKPGYQWYTKIEVACQNFRAALMKWRHYDEELDYGFRQDLTEHTLPSQIARLNRMHREISGIDDLINVADGIDLIFKYRRFWTHEKMRREAPVAVSIMGVIRDLQKVCQSNDWLFEDRAPFLAYKVDLLLRRHQLRGLRGTSRLGYKAMDALLIERRTLRSSSKNTFESENRSNLTRTTQSHQAAPSTLSSWRRSTKLDPDDSGTTTSIGQSDELLPFTHRMKSMSIFSLSWGPRFGSTPGYLDIPHVPLRGRIPRWTTFASGGQVSKGRLC